MSDDLGPWGKRGGAPEPSGRRQLIWLALILGGAVGNLWDRVLHGWVTDFLLVYYHRW